MSTFYPEELQTTVEDSIKRAATAVDNARHARARVSELKRSIETYRSRIKSAETEILAHEQALILAADNLTKAEVEVRQAAESLDRLLTGT